jgi:tetratricopeptide (TPR) repeat protein
MKTLRIRTVKSPVALAKKLFKLERSGRYKAAMEELAVIWPDLDLYPDVEAFEPREAAEILLRCGSLIGFYGHTTQQKQSQERSRNLLEKAHGRFFGWTDVRKTAECENYLALSYWRTGEHNEAQIWMDAAFSRDLADTDEIRLFSHIIQCLINIPAKKDRQNLAALKSLQDKYLDCGDDCLIGDFYNHCGLALDNLNRKAEAVDHFELAKYYYERSGHKIYLGTIENNLAWLYKDAGKFAQAHASIDNAARLFRLVNDKTREGFSFDTKASVYFAESKYADALKTVERAVSVLKKGENTAYLIETLLTKAKILLYLDNFTDAIVSLIEAVNAARVQTGEDAAKRLIDEFEAALQTKNTSARTEKPLKPGDFELILPESIGQYSDYRGVWINTTRLEDIGLARGSLAVVATAKVSRGDLVALTEIENGEVSCGFYDADFGVVCLEGCDGEPEVFNEKDVVILGKIVGVCKTGQREDGKMAVKALKL